MITVGGHYVKVVNITSNGQIIVKDSDNDQQFRTLTEVMNQKRVTTVTVTNFSRTDS